MKALKIIGKIFEFLLIVIVSSALPVFGFIASGYSFGVLIMGIFAALFVFGLCMECKYSNHGVH